MQPIDIVRGVNQAHPSYLQENINATCYQFTHSVIEALRAEGFDAYHVCKTAGEGQYTPPGFTVRTITGLDNKVYICTGVSHDAIWCNGEQVDIVGGGNDSPEPIQDGQGNHLRGTPTWNVIPKEFWRPQNPPLKVAVTPAPVHPSQKAYPGDAYFINNIGVILEEDYKAAGQSLNAGSAVWFSRTIWRHVNEGMTMDDSVKKSRKEWRQALGLPEVG